MDQQTERRDGTIEATSGHCEDPSAHVPGNSRAISFWPSYQQSFIGLMCTLTQILGAFALKGKPACAHSGSTNLIKLSMKPTLNGLTKQLLRRWLPLACELLCLGDLLISHPE